MQRTRYRQTLDQLIVVRIHVPQPFATPRIGQAGAVSGGVFSLLRLAEEAHGVVPHQLLQLVRGEARPFKGNVR